MGTYQRKWQVIQRTQRNVSAVDTGKRRVKLGRNRALVISDPAEALHIEQGPQKHDLLVAPTDNNIVEPGHTYTFTNPGMPWAKYDDLGRRIKEKGDGKEKARSNAAAHRETTKDERRSGRQKEIAKA